MWTDLGSDLAEEFEVVSPWERTVLAARDQRKFAAAKEVRCEVCGSVRDTRTKQTKYCSPKCRRRAGKRRERAAKPKPQCLGCGVPVREKYCSRKCRYLVDRAAAGFNGKCSLLNATERSVIVASTVT